MFTIEQIKAAHAKVKSGADFPKYIQDMKQLGVTSYQHYVADGHIKYYGENNFTISGDSKWEIRPVTDIGQVSELKQILKTHQQGQTNYPTFCLQAAEIGVEKWVVDTQKMTCTYYDKAGKEMLVEAIPELR
ncbi:MAG TPA: DUF1398 family protein [Bacteroidia bacterium]|nr:DUF1398 family protein [Bacteroidia bacterium]